MPHENTDPLLSEGISKLANLDEPSQQGIVKILLPPDKFKQMEVLPETLFDHPFFGILRRLDLSGWRMTSLPEGVGQLVNLKKLNLAHSRIKTLPEGAVQQTFTF